MTEADIPLRAQIADVVERSRTRPDYGLRTGVNGQRLRFVGEWNPLRADEVADALLAKFDIRPRGSLPVNEEPQTQ